MVIQYLRRFTSNANLHSVKLLGVPLNQLVEKFIVNTNKRIGNIESEIFHRNATIRATETSLAVIREILSLYDSSQVE